MGLRAKLLPIAGLALFLYGAYFFRFREFGLYEDDLYFLVNGLNMRNMGELLTFTGQQIATSQGNRPLFAPLAAALAYFSAHLTGHLWGVILAGFASLLACAYAFHEFVRVAWGRRDLAFLSALLFLAWSADTTRALTSESFMPIPALSLFWLFALLYAKGRRRFAFASFFLATMVYEITLPLCFLVIALFSLRETRGKPARARLEAFTRRAAPYFAFELLYVGTRWFSGEGRLATALAAAGDPWPLRIFRSMLQGPLTALSAPFGRSSALLSFEEVAFTLLAALAGWGAFALLRGREERAKPLGFLEPFAFGLLFGMMAYLLFALAPERYPPTFLVGRATDLHKTGLFGLALALASLALRGLELLRSRILAGLAHALLLTGLASLAAQGVVIQAEYARAWRLTKTRWQITLPLAARVGDGSAFLLTGQDENTPQILNSSWMELHLFSMLYELPADWKREPLYLFPWPWLAPFSYELRPATGMAELHNSQRYQSVAGLDYFGINFLHFSVPLDRFAVFEWNEGQTARPLVAPAPGARDLVELASLPKKPLYHHIFEE